MKTFIERLEDATTTDSQLEVEIYLGLYREDFLRSQRKTEEDVVDLLVLWSLGKTNDWDAVISEHENREAYKVYDGQWKIWARWIDGTVTSTVPPRFTPYFEFALPYFLRKDVTWAAGFDPAKTEKRYWFTLNEEATCWHRTLSLAMFLAVLKHRYAELKDD